MESLKLLLSDLLPVFQMIDSEKRNLGTRGQGSSVGPSIILRQGSPQREHRSVLAEGNYSPEPRQMELCRLRR